LLFRETNAASMDLILENINDNIRALGNWEDCHSQHRYNTAEKVSLIGSQFVTQEKTSFWKNHFAKIGQTNIPA
jgi:hypothetical protein